MTPRLFAMVREARGATTARAQEFIGELGALPKRFQDWPAPAIYAVSIASEKAVSLISLPMMALYLPPSSYGSYDVAVSIVEIVNIVMSLAIGATLVRFASTASSEHGAKREASELLGTMLLVVAVVGGLLVAMAPSFTSSVGIEADPIAFRLLVAAAVLTPCIELPLVWLRLKDRALLYFLLAMLRSSAQLIAMFFVLHWGYGVPGVMTANGICMILFAIILLILQVRDTGISCSKKAIYRILVYGLPIVAAGLCQFLLGNANRLFLPGVVATEVIGHVGLATRMAMIVWLVFSPFDLWWGPRRIATLTQPGGHELGARMWGIGLSLLLTASVGLALVGPAVMLMVFPKSYAPAVALLGPLILVQVLHHSANLTNVGVLARNTGFKLFAIDAAAAALAVTGYLVLLPKFAINGMLIAMILGFGFRLGLYIWAGYERAPLPYPWLAAITSVIVGIVLAMAAPATDQIAWRLLYSAVAIPLFACVTVVTGLASLSGGTTNVIR